MQMLTSGEGKLKIILTPAECERFAIADIDKGRRTEGLRRGLCEMLRSAGEQVGFEVKGERLLLQVFSLPEGAELFLTRLSLVPEKDRRALMSLDPVTYSTREVALRIDTAADLGALARAFPEREVSLFCLNGGYYISLREGLGSTLSDLDPILEFCDRVPALPFGLGGEYGKLVGKGALSDVVKFVN